MSDHTRDQADDRSAAAIERWWAALSEDDRHAAERVVRGGGFLTLEMSRSLVREGIPVLMPDDVRVYVKQQTLGRRPPA